MTEPAASERQIDIAALRAKHEKYGGKKGPPHCISCQTWRDGWPCDTATLLDAYEQQTAELGRAREALEAIVDFDDSHGDGYVDEWQQARAFSLCQERARAALASGRGGEHREDCPCSCHGYSPPADCIVCEPIDHP
jgi:hypothetical protein